MYQKTFIFMCTVSINQVIFPDVTDAQYGSRRQQVN